MADSGPPNQCDVTDVGTSTPLPGTLTVPGQSNLGGQSSTPASIWTFAGHLLRRGGWSTFALGCSAVLALMVVATTYGYLDDGAFVDVASRIVVVFFSLATLASLVAAARTVDPAAPFAGACIHGVHAIALAVAAPIFFSTLIETRTWQHMLVLFLGSSGAVGVLAHFWSIRVIDKMVRHPFWDPIARKVHPEKWVDTEKRECRRGCLYCGADEAQVICKACQSLQWSRLIDFARHFHAHGDIKNLEDKKTYRWGSAVFVAHHRWKLLAAGASAVVVGALAYGMQFQAELWRRRHDDELAQSKRSQEVIDALTEHRAGLLRYMACVAHEEPNCETIFGEVVRGYMRVSWRGPGLLHTLGRSCEAEIAGGQEEKPFAKSCQRLGKGHLINDLDIVFADFLKAHAAGAATQELCDTSYLLFCEGKRLGCNIENVAYPKAARACTFPCTAPKEEWLELHCHLQIPLMTPGPSLLAPSACFPPALFTPVK